MAGMPPSLIERATEILKELETRSRQTDVGSSPAATVLQHLHSPGMSNSNMQLSIFDAHSETFEEIRQLLEGTDINRLTPVEALLKLQEIKGKLK
jgi:DNA mismatch repair protein MutS